MNIKTILTVILIPAILIPLAADENAGKKASLWRENSSFSKMVADPRACSINDIVTIKISENSIASNKANLNTVKKTQMNMGIDDFLGFEKELGPKVNDNFNSGSMIGATTNNSNQGGGESKRETRLSTYISARVIEVMANGNLVIEAKKEVMVNKEKQVGILSGIIRPRDISYDNVIESNKIADMQVTFNGKGPVSEQAKRGWLSWILGVIWPF